MLKVIKSGFYTSIQDCGRFGYRVYGVPVSGSMDLYSSQFANTVIGNSRNDAVLEITMTGPKLEFLKPTVIAISGADISPTLNEKPIKMDSIITVQVDDVINFGALRKGIRAYLAIKGGFRSNKVLESRSMYNGITSSNRIQDYDKLVYESYINEHRELNATVKYDRSIIETDTLEVFKGPEFNRMSKELRTQIINSDYKIYKLNNRMAYQFMPLFKNDLKQILTSPVLPGTVQLTPSGQLIVLMRDCQTTGGYPRILQLSNNAINILSQKTEDNCLKIRLKEF
jgi:biotin-dependent carboxylase-like uncharacterized protein